MAEDEQGGQEAEAILLIESRLLSFLLFPFAMEEVERIPPANDAEPPGTAPDSSPDSQPPRPG